jgi:transglutaminase-like putative cysteine protease/tetratricopeptide (TPR) repeat protein
MKIWAPVVLTVSLLVSGSGTARAQANAAPSPTIPIAASPAAAVAKTDYPGESYIFNHLNRTYTYAADGTGSREFEGVVEIRNQAGVKAFSVLTFDFASSAEHVEIEYVRVLHADGSVVTTPAADAQELPDEVTREAPFYSDLKQEQIPVRSLQPGDLLEYRLRIVRTKPEAPGHFWGNESFFLPSSGMVIRSEVIELHVPKDTYIQVWSPNYKPTITETLTNGPTNGTAERVYHWQSAQLNPVAGKTKNALLKLDHNPTLGTSDDPPLPSIAWTNFHSWQEVGAWYRNLEGARTQPDDDVRAKVATLIAGKSTPEEKAQAIYNFVSAQVRYIGVAFGVGRFQPHDAGDVLNNQYGDCKDKSTLLISMLSAAGIPADAVLIGAGITFNSDLPSPGSFNHAITLAHIDGQPVWLDSTAEVSPYQLLNPIIRDKRALIIPATGDAHIETTPKDPPFLFLDTFTAIGTLDDQGTSHSHIVMTYRSDDEVTIRQAVRTVSPAQWDELMQRFSYAMGYSGKVTNTQFSRPDDTSTPYNIAYDYEREKNGDWDNLRIIAQVPPVSLADIDEKDPPVTPIELGVPHTETAHAVMTIPKGWNADLPASIHNKTPFATLDVTYKFENGAIVTDRRLVILQQNIPASDWQAYHKWFTDSQINNQPFIQLHPSASNPAVNTDSASATGPAPDNAELIRQSGQAELRNDWTTARSLLDKVQANNPNQPYLWSAYASIALHDHNTSDAVADCQKELASHPDEGNIARTLASLFMSQKKPEAAITTLQTSIDRNPTDASLVLFLATIFTQSNDNASAEQVLRAGITSIPKNTEIKMQLGTVLLHENKNPEGETVLRSVISSSNDPLALNNAAYGLADSSLDLPLAETASRRSLDLLDQASNNGETGPNARFRASLIVSAWDTYGWILYRDNKIAEAEPWIRAAWRNGISAESGYHLAMILEKQNHLPEALNQLELSSKGERGTDPVAVQKLIDDETAKLLKSAHPTLKNDAAIQLQNDRTYKLPRGTLKPTGQGWATVELDVTTQGTSAFRIIDGDQSLQPLSGTVQHLNLDLDLPPASQAKLLRRGVLSCHEGPTCELVLVSTTAN